VAAFRVNEDEEGLGGEDWRDNGILWRGPDPRRAEDEMMRDVFDSGNAGIWSTGINELSSMGVLVGMYFRLIMYTGCFFTLATILCIPALFLHFGGERLA